MTTKRAGAEPGDRPVRPDDDVRAWIVIGLIAVVCSLVGLAADAGIDRH